MSQCDGRGMGSLAAWVEEAMPPGGPTALLDSE